MATRIGGIPETIQDGIHGALADPGDVKGLARALEQMLADPAKRQSCKEGLARPTHGASFLGPQRS